MRRVPLIATALAVASAMTSQAAAASSNLRASFEKSLRKLTRYGSSGGVLEPRRRYGPGWTVTQVKRMKRKRRNQLRAKGQHRKAVR